MYAETGLRFPYLQDCPQEDHPLEEELLSRLQASDGHRRCLLHDTATINLVQTTTISDHDLSGEGDNFKSPKPIIEEPGIELDHMAAAMSMWCNSDIVACTEAFKVTDLFDPIQNGQPLIEDLNNLLGKSPLEEAYSHLLVDVEAYSDLLVDVELPTVLHMEGEDMIHNDNFIVDEPVQKSVSSGSPNSLDQINAGFMRPEFFDVQEMGLGVIQAVANDHMSHFNGSTVHFPSERLLTIDEERWQKLSRYRKKKTKRNYGRRIKYAGRKALADSQLRVRGRFAKTEEYELANPSK